MILKRRVPHIFKHFHLRRNHRCHVLRYADKSVDKPSPTRHTIKTRFPQLNYGQITGGIRTLYGHHPSRDACRAGGCVFVRCSFCVRSSFGRVLCGVSLVLVRVAFVRGGSQGEAADCGRRRVHIRTGDRSAPRRTRYGRDRDRLGTAHGLCTDVRRTGNGHQSSGGRAGIRLMPTFCDIPRWAAARRQTCNGLITDASPTDGQRTGGALRTTRPTNASAPIIHINTAKAKIEAAGGIRSFRRKEGRGKKRRAHGIP